MERLRFIDGDSHVLEPEAIWDLGLGESTWKRSTAT